MVDASENTGFVMERKITLGVAAIPRVVGYSARLLSGIQDILLLDVFSSLLIYVLLFYTDKDNKNLKLQVDMLQDPIYNTVDPVKWFIVHILRCGMV